jgi:hypothetical protein
LALALTLALIPSTGAASQNIVTRLSNLVSKIQFFRLAAIF